MLPSMYRYRLSRLWDRRGTRACWIMLNPSTANESVDDPTIRRVTRFSRRWGFGSVVVVNLFALRSTDPSALRRSRDPVGPDNDGIIADAVSAADLVVAAWGNQGAIVNPMTGLPRHGEVSGLLAACDPHCLGITAEGQPRHPLYLRSTARLAPLAPIPTTIDP